MNLRETLKEFDMSDKEIELYLHLLEIGSATSGELMKDLNFYSKTVYEILDRLIDKGLVSYSIQSNIKGEESDRRTNTKIKSWACISNNRRDSYWLWRLY